VSASARHDCFVIDASVAVKTAETSEMDDDRVWGPPGRALPFRLAQRAWANPQSVRSVLVRSDSVTPVYRDIDETRATAERLAEEQGEG
jgi:hypothetical protein